MHLILDKIGRDGVKSLMENDDVLQPVTLIMVLLFIADLSNGRIPQSLAFLLVIRILKDIIRINPAGTLLNIHVLMSLGV